MKDRMIMANWFSKMYDRLILQHPVWVLCLVAVIVVFAVFFIPKFRLDASADSLVLENDEDLRYYREVANRYGDNDFLIISYTPTNKQLFDQSRYHINQLTKLRDELSALASVRAVVSILDIPLLQNPTVTLDNIDQGLRSISNSNVDLQLAQEELITSPVFSNLLLSEDGNTTGLLINLHENKIYNDLLKQREQLRYQSQISELNKSDKERLKKVSDEFNSLHKQIMDGRDQNVQIIRHILDDYRNDAQVFLGGLPMIVTDMVSYIAHDLVVFGLGVLCFIILTLTLIFRRIRWVLLPLLCCFLACLIMLGYLGFIDWPVTVISSNFVALLLIITLSLTIHLTVRYHELYSLRSSASQHALVLETVHQMARPCFYTALTTMVAFSSLVVSGIRPVIDFGKMMTMGIITAFILAFLLFPSILVLLTPLSSRESHDFTGQLTLKLATLTDKHGLKIVVLFFLLVVFSMLGIWQLSVENRFIDYFKQSTEIYQGMNVIDTKLGGTTPLDIIIDADSAFYQSLKSFEEDDPFTDDFSVDNSSMPSYWINSNALGKLNQLDNHISNLPGAGKVMSLATTMRLLDQMTEGKKLNDFELALLYSALPSPVREALVDPYYNKENDQVRITMRLMDSFAGFKRQEFLDNIESYMINELEFKPEQVHLTGMGVLYNNMLQSLFGSQIVTIGVVFICILLMFIILFRSFYLAIIGIIPNLLAAGLVLGLMGWLNISLDMMTITIAAITVGIAVDNTIHYMHRFRHEFNKDHQYRAAMRRCHITIGRALYFTSMTIIVGFSILSLSNFIPTIYFGLFTAFAMFSALLGALSLLPLFLVILKPLGNEKKPLS